MTPKSERLPEWCDHKMHYAPSGTTRPYTDNKRYRACEPCRARMVAGRAAYAAAGFGQMGALEQRASDGDR